MGEAAPQLIPDVDERSLITFRPRVARGPRALEPSWLPPVEGSIIWCAYAMKA